MTAHPLTITSHPKNAGQVGHPEYGRHKFLSLRVMEELYEQMRHRQKARGFATLNDYVNYLAFKDSESAELQTQPTQPQASPQPAQEAPTVEVPPTPGGEGAVASDAPTPKATKDERDPLERFWEDRFAPLMRQEVSEQNFDLWLASCRFLAVSTARCILEVPNAYFFDYLGEHYADVIEEALHELVGPESFLKLEVRPERKEEPKPEAPKEEEQPQSKYDQRIAILWRLQYSTKIYAQFDAIRKQLEAKWAEEDRAENPLLRQPGDPRRQRQHHQGNRWDPDP
jgi:hypothetical protein